MEHPAFDASFIVVKPLVESMDLRLERVEPDEIVATWSVGPESHQPFGLVHGGVHCMIVEGLCSMAGTLWLGDEGHVVGVHNATDFYRGVREGRLTSTVRPVHRGRSQQVWEVDTRDEQDRLVARGQLRLQNLRDR